MGKITLIVAHDGNRGIGKDNQLCWKIPNDMKHFKKATMGHVVVMGRNTFESIGKPLEGRINVVLSSSLPETEGIFIERDFKDLLHKAENINMDVFVIGGESIYKQFLPYADEVLITEVDGIFGCDTFFPKLSLSNWELVDFNEGIQDEENIPHTFFKFERRNN